ncbi:MAG: glutamate decarboxylase, partial [Carnobacterium sp.]
FKIYNDGSNIPIVCYTLKNDAQVKWSLYDLADRLLMKGWQVPAYPLPKNMDNIIIQRFVCRADLTMPMAEEMVEDFKEAIKELATATVLGHDSGDKVHGFTH